MFWPSVSAIIGRKEYWFTKKVKGKRPLLRNSGYKIVVNVTVIIPKTEY
jgi:hypothetical protein